MQKRRWVVGKGYEMVEVFLVDQVRYLPGLFERYWARLDEARRAAVGMRTEMRVEKALGLGAGA